MGADGPDRQGLCKSAPSNDLRRGQPAQRYCPDRLRPNARAGNRSGQKHHIARSRQQLLEHPGRQVEFDFQRHAGQVAGHFANESGQHAGGGNLSRAQPNHAGGPGIVAGLHQGALKTRQQRFAILDELPSARREDHPAPFAAEDFDAELAFDLPHPRRNRRLRGIEPLCRCPERTQPRDPQQRFQVIDGQLTHKSCLLVQERNNH